jgi:hypothetical protein
MQSTNTQKITDFAVNRKKLILPILLFIIMIAILYHHSVNNSLTKDDYEYIPKFLNNISQISKESTYEEELDFISVVQLASFDLVPNAGSIPKNQKREPKELYLAKVAGCSDRSRLLEKIFRYSGFKTRHIATYEKENTNSSIKPFITPQNKSHALTEVLTKKGWLVVESNYPWLSIDSENNPISIKKLQQSLDNSVDINWKKPVKMDELIDKPFVFIYGVYSRHGRFFPPYNFIPDINYGEFIQNVF